MKTTSLISMAMTALLMAGCSQNEITDISPDASPAVGFNVYATAQTRGTVTDNTTTGTGIKNATGFGVLAYYTGQALWNSTGYAPNFMYNQQVKFVSSAWTYAPVKYWPNTEGDKISFFAYAPYESTPTTGVSKGVKLSANTLAGAPTLRFVMKPTATDHVDLVATNATATSGVNQAINITKRTAAVAFKFDHVLTRLNFKAKLDATPKAGTHIFVTGMRLVGKTKHAATKFYSEATYKFVDGTWDYTTVAPVAQTADYAIDAILNKASQTATVSGYTTTGIKINSITTGNGLLKSNEYLFLIPPTDLTGVESDQVKVEIDYDILTIDSNLSGGFSKTSTKATVSLPKGTLARNKAYDFLFTIGLEEVQISATVEDWTAPDANVAIPSEDAAGATAAIVNAAIAKLNVTKAANANCNYFVVNITGAPATSTALTGASNFVSGDKIELKCSSVPAGTYTLTGWTTSKANNSIFLTKN